MSNLMETLNVRGFWPRPLPAFKEMMPDCIGYIGVNCETVFYGRDYRNRSRPEVHSKARQEIPIEKVIREGVSCDLERLQSGHRLKAHTVHLEFDGGMPSKRFARPHGSWQIDDHPIQRVRFGGDVQFSDQSEIRTLLAAVSQASRIVNPGDFHLEIHGDSTTALLVCEIGMKRDRLGLKYFVNELRECLSLFKSFSTHWRKRAHSVALFGH